MVIKTDILGWFVYSALAAQLYAAVALAARRRVLGGAAFATGFALCVAAFAFRWLQVGHVPLQSMFEVFLALGMVVYPLSVFSQQVLGATGQAAHAAIAAAVLFPAAFVFGAEARHLPPALNCWLFVPHVASYMLAYIVMAMAAVQASAQLAAPAGSEQAGQYELATHRLVRLGFPLLTGGLVLGAWWGKLAWGDYWHWEAKELWALATWLIFAGYLHLRPAVRRRLPRVGSGAVIAGAAAIVMTLLWVNLAQRFAGLHSYATP